MSLTTMAKAQEVETVVVTGSRIPQVGLYSSSPVTAVGQTEIKYEGATSVETLLNNLPSVFSGQQNFTGNASTGTATVDLRGLGAARTLVLVDGVRLAPGDPVVPVADLNQIPASLVDRIEVLTGGASAVYGSDAEGGVVNFIMRKDFEGVEVDATYGSYQHNNDNTFEQGLLTKAGGPTAGFFRAPSDVWDGGTVDTTLIVGTNTANGKGNITAYLGFRSVHQVLQSSRDYSACSVSAYRSKPADANGVRPYDAFKCAGSANYDLFYGVTGPHAGGYYFMNKGGALVPFTGASTQYFNYGPYNSIQRPDTRYTGGFFAHYEVDPRLQVYSSMMFTDDHTSWQAAPSGLFLGSGPISGTHTINCDNPLLNGTDFYNFYCDSPTSTAQAYIGRRNVEGGPRITDFEHSTYRMQVGARGELWGGWSYDVYGQYSRSQYNQTYQHDFSKARVQDALNAVTDPVTGLPVCASGNAGCVPLDIFHGIGGITPAMEQYIYTHGQQAGYTEEQLLSGSITGDLGQWGVQSPWAKSPVAVSLGAEYRAEYLEQTTSDADQHGDLYGAGGVATGTPRSGFNVTEGFGEVRVPLVQDVPFVRDLTATAGYRYSSYSTAGNVTSYKYGLEWQPIDDFRLRGSFNRAVRAPNVLESFAPQSVGLGSYSDPCASSSPTATLAQCELSGVTAAQYGHLLQCPASQCNVLLGGNRNVGAEKSNTLTYGIVLTPTFLDGVTATVDYFDIKVNNFIGTVPPDVTLNGCLAGDLPDCALVHRDANGLLFTPTGYTSQLTTNTGYLKTKGIDFEFNYNTDLSDWHIDGAGSLSFNFVGTYLSDYTSQSFTGDCKYVLNGVVGSCVLAAAPSGSKVYTSYDCTGLYGVACGSPNPEWRHKLRGTWSTPWDFSVSVDWRHLSSEKFAGNEFNPYLRSGGYCPAGTNGGSCTPLTAGGTISAYDYFDLSATWNMSEKLSLTWGVNNVFDKDPPLLPSGGKVAGPTGPLNGNTFPGVYDPLGRFVFMTATAKL
jgi:outer membrane receptor protein involved in Fe transport